MSRPGALLPRRLGIDAMRVMEFLAYAGIFGWVLILVLAHSTGRLETAPAIVLLAFPLVAFGVMLRPAWVVLFIAAAPLAQVQIAPTRALALLMLVTLVGQLIMRGRISLGWRSGFIGLWLLLVASSVIRADLSGIDELIARGFLNSLAFQILLGVVTYNAVRMGDLRGTPLINALLVGLAITVALEMTVFASGVSLVGALPIGRPTSYLAAVGLSLCFARLITRDENGSLYHPILHAVLAVGFFLALFPGLQRGAWISAVIAITYISLRARRVRYVFLAVFGMALILTVPLARERVVPGDTASESGGYTTGRFDLWKNLWEQIEPGLPLGNGFGHTFTLDSEDLFGAGNTSFATAESTFVYPHNDFLFWMVELGFVGLLGVVIFWGQLLAALRFVLRSASGERRHVMALISVVIAALVAQLVGSTFFFPALAIALSISAGFIFGVRNAIERASRELEPTLRPASENVL
jgi:hypothetical protein